MSVQKTRAGAWGIVIRDPGVTVGRFRIYCRADGHFAVCEPTRPLGQMTVALARTLDDATKKAEKLNQ